MANQAQDILYRKRSSSEIFKEVVLGDSLVKWAYHHPVFAPVFSFLFFRHRFVSSLLGKYCDSALSRRQIEKVIKSLNIDESEILDPVVSFRSFNDFFYRRLKRSCRPLDDAPEAIISPADGRILVYPHIKKDTVVPIKGSSFTISALLKMDAEEFYHGPLAVIRLCPADYHRFHFPCDGEILQSRIINGRYHSVNPIALAKNIDVFGENKRVLTVMQNDRIGKIVIVEVGAFGVGSIVQTFKGDRVKKGQEKGYFKYGGSTVVLLFQPERITFSADLIANSLEGYETFLRFGERMATTNSRR